MRKGLLVRVGIDSSKESGSWIAPLNPITNEFAYVPIIENREARTILPTYEAFIKPCEQLRKKLPSALLPSATKTMHAHLDPDFERLTYGDISGIQPDGKRNYRGKPLLQLEEDDLLVFYASLDPRNTSGYENKPLTYAIIGIFILDSKPQRAVDIFPNRCPDSRNAHTRVTYNDADIIARGKPGLSGRLSHCIPIGGLVSVGQKGVMRYFLESSLYKGWGGFSFGCKQSLYLQRSGALPSFQDADSFYSWFTQESQKRDIEVQRKNN